MADPQRVRAFLDMFGGWDPTLAFVMARAILPMAIACVVRARLETPLAADQSNLPETRRLDAKLAAGTVMFGIGWGVAGLCPDPALADLAIAPAEAAPFVAAMLTGMAVHRFAFR